MKKSYVRALSNIVPFCVFVASTVSVSALNVSSLSFEDKSFVIENSFRASEAGEDVYPSSVTDFTTALSEDGSSIEISLKAPTLSHHSLGSVNDEPLSYITRIDLYRNINYGDYSKIHSFENPTPGETLNYSDTDLSIGGYYFYKAIVYVGSCCDYGEYPAEEIMVGQRPGDVTDFTATSTKGKAPVIISLRAPSVDLAGQELKEKVSIALTRYDAVDLLWKNVNTWTNVEAGSLLQYSDTEPTEGEMYQYKAVCSTASGNSYGELIDIYVGVDLPAAPTDVNAQIVDNGVLVNWTAPTVGANNGYVDFENLTYIVYRGNGYSDYDATEIARDVKDCSFIDTRNCDEEENVRYFVKGVSMEMEGYSASSNLILVGPPSTLPYKEGFNTLKDDYIVADHASWSISSPELSANWAFADVAQLLEDEEVAPYEGAGLAFAYYGPYNTEERDDYLTSGRIDISNAAEVKASFKAYVLPEYDSTLVFELIKNDGTVEPLHELCFENFDEQGWQLVECDLTAYKAASPVQLRFHAHKGVCSASIIVDDLQVVDGVNGIYDVTEVAEDGNVYVKDSKLYVQCADNLSVNVYSLDGRLVYTSYGNSEVALTPSLYIVKVGNTATKVIVK